MSQASSTFDLTTDEGARGLLEAAVRTASPSGSEDAVARLLVDALGPHVDHAALDEVGNAVALAGHGPRHVLLLGHLDTVPGDLPVEVREGVLHGRGSVDAKGSAVALAVALARSGPDVRSALTLRWVGAVEEEVASSRGAHHVLATTARPDLLIVGEPSGWSAVTLGYKGRLRVRLTAQRATAHPAREDTTASEAVVDAWRTVRDWTRDVNRDGAPGAFDRLQASLVHVASSSDGFEDRAVADVAFRLPPTWPPESVRAALTTLDVGPLVQVEADEGEIAVRGPRDGMLARTFRVAIRAQGGAPSSKVKTGTSDWNVLAKAWDVEALAYGPGDANLDHTPAERLPLADFDRAVAVVTSAFEHLAADVTAARRTDPSGPTFEPPR